MGIIIIIIIVIIMTVSWMHVLHQCTFVRSSEHNMPYCTQTHFYRGGQFLLEHSMFCVCL
jgi:amino acid permease